MYKQQDQRILQKRIKTGNVQWT